MLAVSGHLDRAPFGPPVPVAEDSVGQVLPDKDSPRRSIYLQARRTKPVSLLAAFDAPAMAINCDRRVLSTSAPQALVLMNSEFTLESCEVDGAADPGHGAGPLPRRRDRPLRRSQASDDRSSLGHGLPASGQSRRSSTRPSRSSRPCAAATTPELAALTDLCQQLLCSNEFLYVD